MSPDSNLEDSLFGVILQDSYKITGLLGQGGMGAVYDALQIRLNKRVAIKVMARELASNAEALNRFHREAMITSGLGHPHIVQVFDFATTPTGQPFLAMEYLDGEDLDRRLGRVGRLSPEQTAHIVKQTASALSATHAQQIVHRDLKPANIYLLHVAGEDDFVKVLDFGISKILAANTKITKASALIGTPDYMSPEQALGGSTDVDHRTDQWALACIAWECLSGKAPFVADTVPAMLFQVVHGEPALLVSQVADLPDGVESVLRKALSKKKDDRFPNVVEFAHALEAAVHGGTAEQGSVRSMVHGQSSSRVVSRPGPEPGTEVAPYASAAEERTERPTTTFSHTAGENNGHLGPPRGSRPKWHWMVAGGGAVALSLVLLLALRPGSVSKRPVVQTGAPSSLTAAVPVPTPPPAALPAPAAPAVPTEAPSPAGQATSAPATATADTKAAAAPEVETKPRSKRAASSARSKAKASQPERRLIKEL
jgi:eukaryotic-like serine/threonine-protein kinase